MNSYNQYSGKNAFISLILLVLLIGGIYLSVNMERKNNDIIQLALARRETTIKMGDSEKILYSLTPEDNKKEDIKLEYDESIIKIGENLEIIPVKPGTTTITIETKDGKKETMTVNVVDFTIPLNIVTIRNKNTTLTVGETKRLDLDYYPENTTEKDVEWVSNNSDIVKVDKDGYITAVSAGQAQITVRSLSNKTIIDNTMINVIEKINNSEDHKPTIVDKKDNDDSTDQSPNVVTPSKVDVKSITVSPSTINMTYNIIQSVNPTINPSNATNKKVTYKSSNPDLVKVDNKGMITLSKNQNGSAVITITSVDNPSVTAKVTVNVKEISNPAPKPTKIDVKSINVSPMTINMSYNAIETISPIVNPSNATNKKVTYKSSNPNFVNVDSDGMVTILKNQNGSAVITITSADNKSVTAKVTINVKKITNPKPTKINVSSITVSPSSTTLNQNGTYTIRPTINPSNATNKSVTYKSSNTSLVSVSSSGVVKALKDQNGSAVITITSADNKSVTAKFTVNVKKKAAPAPTKINVSSITVSPSSTTLNQNGTYTIRPTINPSNATNKSVTYKSSNTSLVSVSSSGVVKALKDQNGSAVITITSADNPSITAKFTVNVKAKVIPVQSIKVSATTLTLGPNSSYQIKTTITPSNATNKGLTYQVNKPQFLSVSNTGVIKPLINRNINNITVTVKSNDNSSAKASITVNLQGEYKLLAKQYPISDVFTVTGNATEGRIAQGFCVPHVGNDIYIVAIQRTSDDTSTLFHILKETNGRFKEINSFVKGNSIIGHGNDATYNPNTGEILIPHGSNPFNVMKLTNMINSKNPSITNKTFYNGSGEKTGSGGGIAYDPTNNMYYQTSGYQFFVYNDSLKRTLNGTKIDGSTGVPTSNDSSSNQGVGAYNGKILVIRYNASVSENSQTIQKPHNAIDIYDSTNGNYLGTNLIYLGKDNYELESVDYYKNGKFLVYYHEITTNNGHIKTINLNLG